MAEKFNPFHKWLGLNEKIKNPHHFQLLGVSPSLTDEDLIRKTVAQNVKRHLTVLAKLPPGKYDEIGAKLKKRIADAQKVLLNPQLRTVYLNKLKAQVSQQQKPKASPATAQKAGQKAASKAGQNTNPNAMPASRPPQATKPTAGQSVKQAGSVPGMAPPAPATPQPAPNAPVNPIVPPTAVPFVDEDVLFQATGPEPGSFPEPGANPQFGVPPESDIGQPPPLVSPHHANAAIPMAVPVAVGAIPGQPIAAATAVVGEGSGEFGEVQIKRSVVRRKKNKWLGPLVGLVLIGAGGAGAYSIYQNYDALAERLGIGKDVPVAPGMIEEKEEPPEVKEPEVGLPTVDISKLEELDVDKVMNDSATLDQTGRKPGEEGDLKNLLSGEMPNAKDTDTGEEASAEGDMNKEIVALNDQQLDRLRRAIQRLRRSLFRRDKKVATEQIAEAKGVIKRVVTDNSKTLPDDQKRLASIVDSSEKLIEAIGGFWGQVMKGTTSLAGGQVVKVGEVEMGFLEADEAKFIMRHNGANVTYQYYHTPPGLAVALGNQGFIDSVPSWSMQQAAFYAVNQIVGRDHIEKVEKLLGVAEEAGLDCGYVREFAEFDFESLGPGVDRIDMDQAQHDDLMSAFRTTNGYKKIGELSTVESQSLSEILLSLNPIKQKQRVAFLEEAKLHAIEAMDCNRVEDAILELDRYANIDAQPMLADSLLDIAKSRRMSDEQTRGLMEMAIPFLKSDEGKSVDKRVRGQLIKQLKKLAEAGDMIDCTWRVDQIQE